MKTKKIVSFFLTLAVFAAAIWFGYQKFKFYINNPWTRDAQVRSQVIQITPRVTGMVTRIYVKDNQFVKAGDPLFDIDPSTYILKVEQAKARLKRAKEASRGYKTEYERVKKIYAKDKGAISQKDLIRNEVNYFKSLADIENAEESLSAAELNLEFTKVQAPVDGWVSNINFQIGSQATANKPLLALVDKNSFWIYAFFREDTVKDIQEGDEAVVTLMAYPKTPLEAKVESIGWGISPSDGNPGKNLLPSIKPIFQWIRLAQRIPVRIELKEPLPKGVTLRVGMSATVLVKKGSAKR